MVDILNKLYDLFLRYMHLASGASVDGGKIIYDASDDAVFTGRYVQINILKDTTFNTLYIDQVDVSLLKGYRNTLPAGTILSPGKGKYFTAGSIDAGGMIQII